jgi:hypothetical protein
MRPENVAESSPRAGAGRPDEGRSPLYLALRIVVALQVLAILVQAVTAGQLLNGDDGMKNVHGAGAGAVHLLGLVQVVLAVLWWRPGRGAGWPALASLVLLIGGFVQSAVGGSHNLAVHVPLGVSLLGLGVAIAVWAWWPGSAVRRGRG